MFEWILKRRNLHEDESKKEKRLEKEKTIKKMEMNMTDSRVKKIILKDEKYKEKERLEFLNLNKYNSFFY